jgi:fucose permease
MKKTNRLLIILAFLCMVIFGFVENLKGTIIPPVRAEFGVSYGNIGIMLLVGSLGYLVATFLGGFAGDRFGLKKVMVTGFMVLMISCVGFLYANSFIMVVILLFFVNVAFGCFEVAVNSLGAVIFVRNAAVMMNLVHLFYGLGSSVGPKYAGTLIENNFSWRYVYFYAIILVGIVFLLLCSSKFPDVQKHEESSRLPIKSIAKNKKVWFFIGLLGFCEVIELGTGNWLVNFLQSSRGMDVSSSTFYLTLFFITFTIGRLFGGFIAERLGYVKIIGYFTAATLILFLGGFFLGNSFAFLFSMMGFFVSIMFPTIMVIIMKEFTSNTSSIMGFIITFAGTVNMVCNWLIGKSNDYFGVKLGFFTLLLYTLLILVFLVLLNKSLVYNKNNCKATVGI